MPGKLKLNWRFFSKGEWWIKSTKVSKAQYLRNRGLRKFHKGWISKIPSERSNFYQGTFPPEIHFVHFFTNIKLFLCFLNILFLGVTLSSLHHMTYKWNKIITFNTKGAILSSSRSELQFEKLNANKIAIFRVIWSA